MIPVYIGYDSRENVGYHVLVNSILSRSSEPVSFIPIALSHLRGIFTRQPDPKQTTEFSFSRFLVPHLSNYQGWSLFCDCDMVFLEDIQKLWALKDDRYAIMVAKHDYTPSSHMKMFNQQQTVYPKKNWSSVVLFNNEKCRTLTPDYVNSATGLELHQFRWLESEALVGDIPITWNFLVGEYEVPSRPPEALHYTLGGPYIADYREGPLAEIWLAEFKRTMSCNGHPVPMPV